jgi:hypothetical protein
MFEEYAELKNFFRIQAKRPIFIKEKQGIFLFFLSFFLSFADRYEKKGKRPHSSPFFPLENKCGVRTKF